MIETLKKYHEMGLILIPVDPKTKLPLEKYKSYRETGQTRDALEILIKKYPLAHWAIYCINGIVGLDFDSPRTYEEFFNDIETLTTKSPSGGYHCFIKSLSQINSFEVMGLEIKVNEPNTLIGEGYNIIKDVSIKEFEDGKGFIEKRLPKLKTYKSKSDKKLKDLQISNIVLRYAEKKADGHNYFTAFCPIHGDTDHPHLYVYTETNSWYCFKCRKGGLPGHFISEVEGIKLKEVPKTLKDKFDIDIESGDEPLIFSTTTAHINDRLYEQVKTHEGWAFVSYQNDNFIFDNEVIDKNTEITYTPCIDDEVIKNAVLLPSGVENYISIQNLLQEINTFINKWLDIPDQDRKFYGYYILQSWVFECFHTIGYPRVLGDTGSGKTRFLDVIGGLCYKPIFTNGAIGAAPVYRIMDKHKGTLIIDEANFGKTDETQFMITILNSGWEKGKPVLRCDKERPDVINTFDPFGPKVLATRSTFYDKALEARCYTVTITQTDRDNIPANIDDSFFEDKKGIVNKLLAFRLKNIDKIKYNASLQQQFTGIEPRIIQKALPLASIVEQDQEAFVEFVDYIRASQETIIEERQDSTTGIVLNQFFELIETELNNGMDYKEICLSAEDIAISLNANLPEKKRFTNQRIGKILKEVGIKKIKKNFNVKTDSGEKKRTSKRSLDSPPELTKKLLRRYSILPQDEYPKLWELESNESSPTRDPSKLNNKGDLTQNEQNGVSPKGADSLDSSDSLRVQINKYFLTWVKNNGVVNSINFVKFCMDCANNLNVSTGDIKPIAEKIFKITPKTNQPGFTMDVNQGLAWLEEEGL